MVSVMMYTASFYEPQNWVGKLYRVSRQHPRGFKTQWETLSFFYPPLDLLKGYRAGRLNFEEFGSSYEQYLEIKYRTSIVPSRLNQLSSVGDFTLLCFEKAGLPCHRSVLASWILGKIPEIQGGIWG